MANPFLGLAAHTTLGFRAQLVTARLSARVLRVARHQIKYPEGFNATVTRKDGLGGVRWERRHSSPMASSSA
jgi:hypothetical protein